MPIRISITPGAQRIACMRAGRLIKEFDTDYLLADHGYDSNAIIEQARKQSMEATISPKKSHATQRTYYNSLYELRHLVENASLHLMRWRGIATRYAKNSTSFLTAL